MNCDEEDEEEEEAAAKTWRASGRLAAGIGSSLEIAAGWLPHRLGGFIRGFRAQSGERYISSGRSIDPSRAPVINAAARPIGPPFVEKKKRGKKIRRSS